MKNIRSTGIRWFRRNASDPHTPDDGHLKVSKYYPAAESWTSSEVWWFDIPLEKFSKPAPDHVHLLCQKSVSSQDFLHLKVPNSVLVDAVNKRSVEVTSRSVVRLHLSARLTDRFVDLRAKGSLRLDLSRFLIT